MTYNPLIPAAGSSLSVSRPQMQTNFDQLNIQYGIDHSPFNTGSGNGTGFHRKSTYPDQTSSVPTSASGQVVVYGINNPVMATPFTMPYYKRDGLTTQFALSPIKALAVFTAAGTGVNPVINSQFNISSINCAADIYTVTLSEAMRSATKYGIVVQTSTGSSIAITRTIGSATQFTLSTASGQTASGVIWTVFVLEA